MRDKVLINVSQEEADGTFQRRYWELIHLGIKNQQTFTRYRKWNSRIQALSEGQERESATHAR